VPESVSVAVASGTVTALVYPPPEPARPLATLILAHGAGAPQSSTFMVDFAQGLARRGCRTITFNFPYTEQGRRLPDRAPTLEACFRDVIAAIRARADGPGGPLVIGGKSMGGRIASHLASQGLEDLAGLVALGYPLHPPGRPEQLRAVHLARIRQPMLIVQGQNDPRVPVTESEQMVAKIRANGGEVWFLVGLNEGHGFQKRDNIDYYQWAVALFLEKLKQ